jgi:hypothetical protein
MKTHDDDDERCADCSHADHEHDDGGCHVAGCDCPAFDAT